MFSNRATLCALCTVFTCCVYLSSVMVNANVKRPKRHQMGWPVQHARLIFIVNPMATSQHINICMAVVISALMVSVIHRYVEVSYIQCRMCVCSSVCMCLCRNLQRLVDTIGYSGLSLIGIWYSHALFALSLPHTHTLPCSTLAHI